MKIKEESKTDKIDLYKKVVVIKDVHTTSMPSVFVPLGTIGHVLDVRLDEDGKYDYLVELIIKGGEVVDHLSEDEIKEA